VLVTPPEGGLAVPSVVALNQIRSIDVQRLVARLGALKPETMERVDQALKISVGLLEI
jgi:mRNA interferase MazF